jgi:hypothetical protein
MLAAFAATLWGAQVRSSQLGFHEYLKHQHNETVVLPKLYEPVPKHVPVVTDRELIRLWEGPGSPILRDPNIEKQLYEAVVAWRNHNPRRFDAEHPTVGHLIRDREFFNYAMHLYSAHTARFVHYHQHLIPFLRGYAMMKMKPPSSPRNGAEMIVPPPESRNDTPPTPPLSISVPEPSSIVLMALGSGLLGTGIWVRRRVRRRRRAQKPYDELLSIGR